MNRYAILARHGCYSYMPKMRCADHVRFEWVFFCLECRVAACEAAKAGLQ